MLDDGKTTSETGVFQRSSTTSERSSTTSKTQRKDYKWRIKINRRKGKNGFTYHWNYALWTGNKQRIKYGGSLTSLMARNPERWQKYLKNSKRKRK